MSIAQQLRHDDVVIKPLIKPRKIQFERAGSHVRARYQGEKTFTIGETRKEATNRLEFWLKEGKA